MPFFINLYLFNTFSRYVVFKSYFCELFLAVKLRSSCLRILSSYSLLGYIYYLSLVSLKFGFKRY